MANKPGVHKKKSRNIAKAKKRMTKKGKKKVAEAKRIAKTNKLKSLKQKGMMVDSARAESKKPQISGDMGSEVSAVDKLFADMQEGEEEELVPIDPEDDVSSDDGVFHDIGEGGGQDPESEEDLEHHADELNAMKEKDPEFYKFLQETNQGLLDFEDVPEDEGQDDEELGEEELEKKKEKKEAMQRAKNILTKERLHFVQEKCTESWNSFLAASAFFHTAVRTLESTAKASTDEKWQEYEEMRKRKEDKEAGKKGRRKTQKEEHEPKKKVTEIHDEEIFSEVMEWSLKNLIGVFTSIASKQSEKKQQKPKKRWHGARRVEEPEHEEVPGVIQVWKLPQFQKVNRYAQMFISDVMYLLKQLADQQMIEYVLRHISTPEAISWLWSNVVQRKMMTKNISKLWAEAKSQPVRLNAFLFLRNAATMSLALKTRGRQDGLLLDSILRDMFRNFAEAARGGYTWRSVNSFRVMENCFLEMLKLDDKTAYRLAFQCVRQLASILRNSCIARSTLRKAGQIDNMKGQKWSQARGKSQKVSESKKKRVEKGKKDEQALVTWPFVRGMYLWTKAIGTLPALRELAYPLSMTILGTVKTRHYTLAMFPLVYHCLYCLNRVAANLEVYIPISAIILTTFDRLNVGIDKTFHQNRKKRARGKKKGEADDEERVLSHAKAPEVEVLIHFSKGLVDEPLCQETMGSSLLFLLVDHMGLLSRSPAFPEIVSMVLLHVRKLRKQCGSEALRRQLTTFIQLAETTVSDVQSRRDYLKEAPSFKKFLVWGPDTALAKQREDMLKRKSEEEKQRIEAEVQENPDKKSAEEALTGKEKKKSRGGKKTREALAAKAHKAEKDAARAERRTAREKAEEEAQEESARKRQKVEQMKGADDKVEEMGFSSGDDED